MMKRARIVKSAGGMSGGRFLQCPQDYPREASGPEHASDFERAPGGHVGGFCRYCFSTGLLSACRCDELNQVGYESEKSKCGRK